MRTRCLLAFVVSSCAATRSLEPPETGLELIAGTEEVVAPMSRPPRPLSDDGIFYVLGEDPAHPRVRYGDGQLALDPSCAIRIGNKLNRRVPPVYVNGQPIGFC